MSFAVNPMLPGSTSAPASDQTSKTPQGTMATHTSCMPSTSTSTSTAAHLELQVDGIGGHEADHGRQALLMVLPAAAAAAAAAAAHRMHTSSISTECLPRTPLSDGARATASRQAGVSGNLERPRVMHQWLDLEDSR